MLGVLKYCLKQYDFISSQYFELPFFQLKDELSLSGVPFQASDYYGNFGITIGCHDTALNVNTNMLLIYA